MTAVLTDEARVTELTDELLAKFDPKTTPAHEFLGAQYDLGLAWVHFPEGFGGLGLSPKLNRNVIQAVSRARGPLGGAKNPIGYG
ncbi:MAG TPA: acyl-CoA dehydrogenase, partial [Acidimicrobiia bacterium]|nr:acyl-CoA dehydrogenase [Acidimicrobiia bacterium]